MRTYIVLSFTLITSLFSCSKEKHDKKTDAGVQTVLKGHVVDTMRGINIDGYKIVLVKQIGTFCAGWECTTQFETVATAYTDFNGDYSITFNYKSESGQGYYLMEQYYGIPYFSGSRRVSPPSLVRKQDTADRATQRPIPYKANVMETLREPKYYFS